MQATEPTNKTYNNIEEIDLVSDDDEIIEVLSDSDVEDQPNAGSLYKLQLIDFKSVKKESNESEVCTIRDDEPVLKKLKLEVPESDSAPLLRSWDSTSEPQPFVKTEISRDLTAVKNVQTFNPNLKPPLKLEVPESDAAPVLRSWDSTSEPQPFVKTEVSRDLTSVKNVQTFNPNLKPPLKLEVPESDSAPVLRSWDSTSEPQPFVKTEISRDLTSVKNVQTFNPNLKTSLPRVSKERLRQIINLHQTLNGQIKSINNLKKNRSCSSSTVTTNSDIHLHNSNDNEFQESTRAHDDLNLPPLPDNCDSDFFGDEEKSNNVSTKTNTINVCAIEKEEETECEIKKARTNLTLFESNIVKDFAKSFLSTENEECPTRKSKLMPQNNIFRQLERDLSVSLPNDLSEERVREFESFSPSTENYVLPIRKSKLVPQNNIFQNLEIDLSISLPDDFSEERVKESVKEELPFPARYNPILLQNQNVQEFDESVVNTLALFNVVSKEINFTAKAIGAYTTRTFKPPRHLIMKLFDWIFESSTDRQLDFRINVMRHIHRLHGFPKSFLLWDPLERAYDLDSRAMNLAIKSCVFDFVCSVLEAEFHAPEFIVDTLAGKTHVYKLVSINRNFGNLKTIITWLEDTIKSYDGYLSTDNSSNSSSSNSSLNTHHFYAIIESVQKLLAFSLFTVEEPKNSAKCIAEEIVLAHNRLESYSQQQLLITGIKSNDLLMITTEKLLMQIPLNNHKDSYDSICYSSCCWEKILYYYFEIFHTKNVETLDQSDLQRYTKYLLLLVQAFMEGSRDHLRIVPSHLNADEIDSPISLDVITEEISNLETRIETLFNNTPEEITFIFSLIKFSLL